MLIKCSKFNNLTSRRGVFGQLIRKKKKKDVAFIICANVVECKIRRNKIVSLK